MKFGGTLSQVAKSQSGPTVKLGGSGDPSLLWQQLKFHGGFSPQTLQIARNGHDSKSSSAFLISYRTITRIKTAIDLDSIPLLSVPNIVNCDIVVLAPEEWNGIKFLALAKNVLGCYLPLSFGYYPMLDTDSFATVRIGPACGIAGSEDSGYAGFQVFIHGNPTIDGQPSLLGQS